MTAMTVRWPIASIESRLIYANLDVGDQNRSGNFNSPPYSTLVAKTLAAVTECSTAHYIYEYSPNWLETQANYDAFGNQTWSRRFGPDSAHNQSIATTYDSVYHLFPVEQKANADARYVESAKYYGVNGPPDWQVGQSGRCRFGQIAEHCGIDDLCVRQSYDVFGRTTRRWEHIPKAAAWTGGVMDDAYADVHWKYYMPGANRTTYTVTEHRKPRCYGNFVRRHYDGLGQLVAETSPNEWWEESVEGCGVAGLGGEIIVNYGYDALGNQTHVSTARAVGPKTAARASRRLTGTRSTTR